MPAESYPFGLDVSGYQGLINWDAIASYQPYILWVAIRFGISWGYTDKFWLRNWQEARRAGKAREAAGGPPLYRSAYLVTRPDEDATRQTQHLVDGLKDDPGELPPTLDVELPCGKFYKEIANHTLAVASELEYNIKRRPIIYSSASWVNHYISGIDQGGSSAPWLNDYYWWLAQYLNSGEEFPPEKMAYPMGLRKDRVLILQTASHGKPIGVESLQMDYDRWIHPSLSLKDLTTMVITPTPGPVAKTRTVLTNGLRVRGRPTTNGQVIGQLNHGDQVTPIPGADLPQSDGYVWQPIQVYVADRYLS